MRKNWKLILIIVIITALPYLIWRNSVRFSPEIFLTEWYKTIFITGIFGLFYKFIIEKRITASVKANKLTSYIEVLHNKIELIENEIDNNPELTLQAIELVKLHIQTSQYKNEFSSFSKKFINIITKIQKYYDTSDHSRKKEMRRNIIYSLNDLKNLIKIN